MAEINWKFKKQDKLIWEDDPWYELTLGGHIKPEKLLDDPKQLEILQDAIDTILDFLETAEAERIIVNEDTEFEDGELTDDMELNPDYVPNEEGEEEDEEEDGD